MQATSRKLIQLAPGSLIDAAQKATRLNDFGGEEFIAPLRVLCAAYNQEANLSVIGRIAAKQDTLRLLRNRLTITDYRTRHPDIAEQQVRRPIFIVGLPRTGTTALHNLMAQDPDNRVPMAWEVMFPSPPPERAGHDNDPRIVKADKQMAWLDRLAPDFKTVHPVSATLPQECIAITAHSFLSVQFPTMYHVPTYQAWLDRQDHAPAYEFHKRFLQHLQWRCPADRWVLKAPGHLFSFDALFETYPDAVVVQTHREPLDVMASLASLIATLHGAFSHNVNPRAFGPELTERWAGALTGAIETRARLEKAGKRFLDVQYSDFVRDPIHAVRDLYARLDIPLTDDAETRMVEFQNANPKDKHGRHQYTLEQFGLDRGQENSRFHAYRERFGLLSATTRQ